MKKDIKYSDAILKSFSGLEYTLDMLEFPEIYSKLLSVIPTKKINFEKFGVEGIIACEMICAAICHQLNWDVLREAMYKKANDSKLWIETDYLADISVGQVEDLLKSYEKKERIRANERASIIREIGTFMVENQMKFIDIFFENGMLKSNKKIIETLLKINVFSEDCVQKKMRLLFQNLSDYKEFALLDEVFEPTIDYHIVRLYIRRGLVKPINYIGKDFLLQHKIRKEKTMAALREVCSDALKEVCWITDLGVKEVNRIEWWIGRSVCVSGQPDCALLSQDTEWVRTCFDKCPYYKTCHTVNYGKSFIDEPIYHGKSY